MADEGGRGPKLHIVAFPWLAFGHMIPMLELCKSMAAMGHRVSFLATTRNIARLSYSAAAADNGNGGSLEFVPLSLPHVPGLPEGGEATSDVTAGDVQHLKTALDGLRGQFEEFLRKSERRPDWVIVDFATYWAPKIAGEIGIPCCFFTVFIASFLAFLGPPSQYKKGRSRRRPEEYTVAPPWIPFSSKVAKPYYAAKQFMAVFEKNDSGISDIDRFVTTLQSCKVLATRACTEIEEPYLELLPKLYNNKPHVIPVGLLPPTPPPEMEDMTGVNGEIFEWLDKQAPRSVVYVAFGSEATLSVEMTWELASGLESSGLPFLWAFRNPAGDGGGALPEGFQETTAGRGLVAAGWVPQLRVLSHPSVGVFLSHSGWSSVVEALQFAVPMVLIPIYVDQHINARVAEEKGFAVEVARDDEDGSFRGGDIARILKMVVSEEEGETVRRSAMELREVFANRERQERYVHNFLRYLQFYKEDLHESH